MNDHVNDAIPKVKIKTFSMFIKKHDFVFNNIFRFMARISKNIFNSTLFIFSIYMRYKHVFFKDIYNNILSGTIITLDQVNQAIYDKIEFFYNINVAKDSLVKINNDILYHKIIDKIKITPLNNNTYNDILNCIIDENKHITFNDDYEYSFIINHILKNIYVKYFNLTLYQIRHHIPCTTKDPIFIEQVTNGKNLFSKELEVDYLKLIKDKIKQILITKFGNKTDTEYKIKLINNILRTFIYNKLGDNKNAIPADVILKIIEKTQHTISSYYAIRKKGLFARMCKYKPKDGFYVVPFHHNSFKLIGNNIRLTLGDHINNNYTDIINNTNYVCVNNNSTHHKYYCKMEHLKIKQKNDKITKNLYYIVSINRKKYYIAKNDANLVNGYYYNIKIPKYKINGNIKTVEVSPLYDGKFLKLNVTYEIGNNQTPIKNTGTPKIKKAKAKKVKKLTTEELFQKIPPTIHNSISVDLGIVNLMTIYDPSDKQYIIKGKSIVSLNSYYNNLISTYKSILDKLSNKPNNNSNNNWKQLNEKVDTDKINLEKIQTITIKNFHENEKFIDDMTKCHTNKEKQLKYSIKRIQNKFTLITNIFKAHNRRIRGTDKKLVDVLEETYYNLLRRRNNKLDNIFNNIVKLFHNKYGSKEYIIMGYNNGWKTKVNMGTRNNRNFYSIPYSKLLSKLHDKFGEKLIITEESYTSKCDGLALEKIGKKAKYLGSRITRGLFKSSTGRTLNADLNGAINIMRKKISLKKIAGLELERPKLLKIQIHGNKRVRDNILKIE